MTPSPNPHHPSPLPSTSALSILSIRAAVAPPSWTRSNRTSIVSTSIQPSRIPIKSVRPRLLPVQSPTDILLSLPSSKQPVTKIVTKEDIMFEAKTDMSITVAQMALALKATIKVVFDQSGQVAPNQCGTVDMVGGANTGSSYSLPGHVIISIPALPAGQSNKLREIRELKLVVEGKSEFWDDSGRYTPVRLYTSTIDLAESITLLIPSCDPLLPTAKRVELAVAFDLRLPGWLPPTHRAFLTNTEYGLVVKSKIGFTEAAASIYTQFKPSDKYNALRGMRRAAEMISQVKIMEEKHTSTYQPFNIHRHRLPSALNHRSRNSTEKSYSIKPDADSSSPIECVVTVPEWVDCYGDERDLKLSLRIKARPEAIIAQNKIGQQSREIVTESETASGPAGDEALPAATSTGTRSTTPTVPPPSTASVPMQRANDDILTRVIELGMEVEEIETYSSAPSTQFKAVFPIPDASEQPDRHSSHNAFISPRSPKADVECKAPNDKVFRGYRTRKCLLAEDGTRRTFIFANDGLGMNECWRKINVVLPMPASANGFKSRPQSEMDGPMLRIKHILKIRVVCRNVGSSGEDMAVVLSVPIQFGTSPQSVSAMCKHPKPLLPAYIQLYHENGEQLQCDPLPIYNPIDPTIPPPSYTSSHSISSLLASTTGSSSSRSRSSSPSARSSTSEIDTLDLRDPSPEISDDGHASASNTTTPAPRHAIRFHHPWANIRPTAKCQAVSVAPTH